MIKKLLGWGAVAFLVFFIAFRSDSALEVGRSMGRGLVDILRGFGDFFTGLVT